jgi:hypothetical protein
MDVQSLFFELFPTCSLDVHRMGIPFTTTNTTIMDVQGVPLFKCRNVGLSGIQSVRYRNEQNADAGTSSVPE